MKISAPISIKTAFWILFLLGIPFHVFGGIMIVTVKGDTSLSRKSIPDGWRLEDWTMWTSLGNGEQAWGSPSYIRKGDFDGDGVDEIVSPYGHYAIPSPYGDYMSRMTASFQHGRLDQDPYPQYGVGPWGSSNYTRVGDFNGDGKDDIASASGGNVYMKLGDTSYHFDIETWTVLNRWGSSHYTLVGDFDGDGKDDIASASGSRVYMKLGSVGDFVDGEWSVTNKWGPGNYTWSGDFNGDGKDDIASASGSRVYMHLSNGNDFTTYTWNTSSSWGASGFTWATDINNDGMDDIVSASGSHIFLRISTGTEFTFYDRTVPNHWGAAGYTWLVDYDGDGLKDIVSAEASNIHIKQNINGTNFEGSTVWAGGENRYGDGPLWAGWWGDPEFTFVFEY